MSQIKCEAARNDLSFCGVTNNIVLNLVSGGMELIKIDLRDVNITKIQRMSVEMACAHLEKANKCPCEKNEKNLRVCLW